ncbi:MAG: YitT family protein [Bacteroidales bacterium]|nr:YitT family protein [Bacteroidales bacterium]MDE7072580.1 YitT family protein [Bacteroidales bacterium]
MKNEEKPHPPKASEEKHQVDRKQFLKSYAGPYFSDLKKVKPVRPFVLLADLSRKRIVRDYLFILLGSAIVAAAYAFFFAPYSIVPGGVYGITIVLNAVSKGWFAAFPDGLPIGSMALCFNIPLWLLAYRFLGHHYGLKTVVTFAATAFFTDFYTMLRGESMLVHNDPLLAAIYGGAILGLGVSLIFKAKGTSAGTDVLAKIVSRYAHNNVGVNITLFDSAVVLLGLIALRSWEVPLYSWIAIFVYGKVVDIIMEGVRTEKAVLITTDKPNELRDAILFTMKRGGTFLEGKGLYSGDVKHLIYTVIPKTQVGTLREVVNQVDPHAFLTILPAYEVLGKGYRDLQKTIAEEKD